MIRLRSDLLFTAQLITFVAIFLLYYPRTHVIDDECNIISLAFSIAHGTVFLEQAGIDLDADLEWRGHRVSKYSPFHAALLAPAIATHWRLAFLINPTFILIGAFVLRRMLLREGLSSGWTILYFANPGLLYYSATLLSMLPAAVMGLVGASLLFRGQPRPFAGGLALGVASLLHIWLAPIAIVLSSGWWIERGRWGLRNGAMLTLGATPCVLALAYYNWATTGSAFLNVYLIIGTHRAFALPHMMASMSFYFLSLLIAPVAGCASLTRRWGGSWTLPATIAIAILLASAYYYRDGLGYGLVGWVPGQRFLLPVALLACLPAAKCLSSLRRLVEAWPRLLAISRLLAVSTFTVTYALLAALHQAYLDTHAAIQAQIRASIPHHARIVGHERIFKELAPVHGPWMFRRVRDWSAPCYEERDGAYVVWLGPPGSSPPACWLEGRSATVTRVESWIWSKDMWIIAPAAAAMRGA